jgi:hypothetical protein
MGTRDSGLCMLESVTTYIGGQVTIGRVFFFASAMTQHHSYGHQPLWPSERHI